MNNQDSTTQKKEMDPYKSKHVINKDEPVLWLNENDSPDDIKQKLAAFAPILKDEYDKIVNCFEHCHEALRILEPEVICRITGRINISGEWIYVSVARTGLPAEKGEDEPRRFPVIPSTPLHLSNQRKNSKATDEKMQEWCVLLKSQTSSDDMTSVLDAIGLMGETVEIRDVRRGQWPCIVIATEISKSWEIVMNISKLDGVAGVTENKGGHLKQL